MLTERYTQAFQIAAQLHQTQNRKGTQVPYLSHLLAVSSLVLEYGGTEDEAIAGLLHDAVEDQGGQATLELIRAQFGSAVADTVWAVSDTDEVPNLRSILRDYLEQVENQWARFVPEAQTLEEKRDLVLWYYGHLHRVYLEVDPVQVGQELRRTLEELFKAIQQNQVDYGTLSALTHP